MTKTDYWLWKILSMGFYLWNYCDGYVVSSIPCTIIPP